MIILTEFKIDNYTTVAGTSPSRAHGPPPKLVHNLVLILQGILQVILQVNLRNSTSNSTSNSTEEIHDTVCERHVVLYWLPLSTISPRSLLQVNLLQSVVYCGGTFCVLRSAADYYKFKYILVDWS